MAMIGTGYRYDRGKVTVALRNLSYNFNGRGDSSLDMRMTGFAAGVTFPF
ncbi:hypothetical protein ACCAA_1050018 [Candidatus Accumulibacter aalborgensis]|uniref:Uncharacterized protein n=1 Tax=Candidatus Accumulibacter aalborgensis TaxID=1860102 RepID=A0A1A8XGM3_9PROT|nr:hypothetical protein [Candidatus Accumulibacter aalborgensis]SBT03512.1 hypothetical protein ACCAA_1050018 [Candidatus Accumulibacter aalborgensis]